MERQADRPVRDGRAGNRPRVQTRHTRLGICQTAGCPAAAGGPIELYDGPGRYCPDCGEALRECAPGQALASPPKEARQPSSRRTAFALPRPALALSGALVLIGMVTAVVWTTAHGQFWSVGRAPTRASSTAAPAAPSFRPMSAAQFGKLLADLAAHGSTTQLSPRLSTALGVTRQGETLTVHQDTFVDSAKNVHGFVELTNGNYLFAYIERYASHLYYVDRRLVLISSLEDTYRNGTEAISATSGTGAQKGLDAELEFFARLSACPNLECR